MIHNHASQSECVANITPVAVHSGVDFKMDLGHYSLRFGGLPVHHNAGVVVEGRFESVADQLQPLLRGLFTQHQDRYAAETGLAESDTFVGQRNCQARRTGLQGRTRAFYCTVTVGISPYHRMELIPLICCEPHTFRDVVFERVQINLSPSPAQLLGCHH